MHFVGLERVLEPTATHRDTPALAQHFGSGALGKRLHRELGGGEGVTHACGKAVAAARRRQGRMKRP